MRTGIPPSREPARRSCSTAPGQDAATALALGQCQNLLKRRLTRPLLDLFRQFTGLRLHVWWHAPADQLSQGVLWRLCPQARQNRATRRHPACPECLRKCWLTEWTNLHSEKRFAGLCGFTNYYACLKLQQQPMATLLVQHPTPTSRAAKEAFSHAISLTRLLLHDLDATLQAGRAVVELESLRQELAGHSPGGDGAGQIEPHTHLLNGKHREQLVLRMVNYIHQHYARPIQLHDLATATSLNASYVSSLFSTTLGVTFHHYLEELRIARAKDLLRDPVKRVSEVAYAVGYSNSNHFRNVFTARVGLPPSAWRQIQVS